MSVGLENIKAGDKVGLMRAGPKGKRQWVESSAERATTTQLVVAGTKFYRKNGFEISLSGYESRDRIAALDHHTVFFREVQRSIK